VTAVFIAEAAGLPKADDDAKIWECLHDPIYPVPLFLITLRSSMIISVIKAEKQKTRYFPCHENTESLTYASFI